MTVKTTRLVYIINTRSGLGILQQSCRKVSFHLFRIWSFTYKEVVASMNIIERATNEKIYLFIHAMHLHCLHGLPKVVIEGILGYLTQRELSGLPALMMQLERKGVLRVRLGSVVDSARLYRAVRDDSVVKRAEEGVRVGMVFTFALPEDVHQLKNIQEIEEIIDEGWAQGVIRDFVEVIAKVSQVKTYELAIEEIPVLPKNLGWGEKPQKPQSWGRSKNPKPVDNPKPKIRKFVTKVKVPSSQVSVGPRGLDNRPAWITRNIENDFLLVSNNPFKSVYDNVGGFPVGWGGSSRQSRAKY
jgi:hypothetical protein